MPDRSKKTISVTVNGAEHTLTIPPDRVLLDMLRENLGLTGTKRGCGNGECGACSVIMDGVLVNSCLVPAMKANGSEILTVEGLGDEGGLHPIQEAFFGKRCCPMWILHSRNAACSQEPPRSKPPSLT